MGPDSSRRISDMHIPTEAPPSVNLPHRQHGRFRHQVETETVGQAASNSHDAGPAAVNLLFRAHLHSTAVDPAAGPVESGTSDTSFVYEGPPGSSGMT